MKTDSVYVAKIANEWRYIWSENNWRKSSGKPIRNGDLVLEFCNLLDEVDPIVEHVRGHQGIVGNEMADRLAVAGIEWD